MQPSRTVTCPVSRSRALLAVRALVACALSVATLAGCGATGKDSSAIPASVRPWTQEFETRAMLVADRVRVAGPVGLIEHLATRPNPEFHEREERTTPDGFVQEVTSQVTGRGSEIYAWLDKLEIVALHQLTVLEGPFLTDVVVEASGDVLWRPLEGDAAERREPSLRLVGKPPEWPR